MNERCNVCEIALNKNTIGLNKKLLGRNIQRFLCMDCLATYLEITKNDLLEKIEEFKAQGCKLFE